jgi:hypothetical protein
MTKKKNFEMSVVESGCEDDLQRRLQEEKQKILQQEKEKENTNLFSLLFTKKRIIILIIWALIYRLSINKGWGAVYINTNLVTSSSQY